MSSHAPISNCYNPEAFLERSLETTAILAQEEVPSSRYSCSLLSVRLFEEFDDFLVAKLYGHR